jgi:DNA-binding transcriptional LysR family regulator
MNEIDLTQLDLNLLVTFEVLMTESSVTRAATRLGRTQSAVSHSLARLREQVGDPLMVKQGGRMRPSPFAEQLIEDVRPILRGIQRVLSPPQPFVPVSSERTFRAAVFDFSPALLPATMAKIRTAAPSVLVEWLH